jgi:hypothetical protein
VSSLNAELVRPRTQGQEMTLRAGCHVSLRDTESILAGYNDLRRDYYHPRSDYNDLGTDDYDG